MEYKAAPLVKNFLTENDLDETKKTIFFNLDEPDINIDEIFNYLINDWMEFIFNLPITTPIFFDLVENGRIHSYKATPEKINIIMNCLQTRNFDQIISGNPLSSDPPTQIDDIIHVSGFGIRVYPLTSNHTNNQRAGSFFNYIYKDELQQCFEKQLERYQTFSSLVDDKGHRKQELEDCCFVHSLKMSHQFQESTLNQIRLKIQNRYLPIKCIEEICNEFKIHLILHYLTEDRNRQILIGVKQDEASYTIEMNLYQKHYFIEEFTPFSCYYVKHFETVDECNYMKEYISQHNSFRKSRYFCRSSDFIRTLFKKNCFIPITYGHFMVLNTEFHRLQDSDSCDTTFILIKNTVPN